MTLVDQRSSELLENRIAVGDVYYDPKSDMMYQVSRIELEEDSVFIFRPDEPTGFLTPTTIKPSVVIERLVKLGNVIMLLEGYFNG